LRVIRGTGIAYPSAAPRYTRGFSGVRVVRSVVFGGVFCRILFVLLSSLPFGTWIVCPSIYGFWLLRSCLGPLFCLAQKDFNVVPDEGYFRATRRVH